MKYTSRVLLFILVLALSFSVFSLNKSFAGATDTNNYQLYSFYDLRERESFVQVTNTDGPAIIHVQVFDVGNLCNENNFFDTYTSSDTHVYNLRDIQTNNGNPSGFVLPDGAYGIVVVTVVQGIGLPADTTNGSIIGNFRVIDDSGYEYRTNSQGPSPINGGNFTFNFNMLSGANASDIIGMTFNNITSGEVTTSGSSLTFDTTLLNNDEVPFSCSNTTFSCTADTFEFGINDAIPNSRDGGVVCGSNVISGGLVNLTLISGSDTTEAFAGYVGLNNDNGRGSMDSMWAESSVEICDDGIDNDGINGIDCADISCDGFEVDTGEVCEPGGETSCDDGFDNDNDGDIDQADSNCSPG